MNILFINSISRHRFGGGEKWMIKAAKGLAEAGHKVLIAAKSRSEILKAAQNAGVKTKIFNIHWDVSIINTLRIAAFLRRENIQILICNQNKDVRVAGLAARLAKTPAVIARNGLLLCEKKWKYKVTLTHLVDNILTNTETIKQAYMQYGWFNNNFIKVIYNGIEDKSHVKPFDFSRDYPHKKIIFSAGRLSEQKGFSYLIDAAAKLAEQRKDIVFIIAGKGRLESELRSQINNLGLEDTVHLIGYIENIDLYIKGCDLFILPSLFEGMPNVVMEAMAVGKAAVATDVNGARELMEPDVTGRLIPAKDVNAIVDAISDLIDNQPLLDAYGRAGLERVKRYFIHEHMIKNLESYFLDLMNRGIVP